MWSIVWCSLKTRLVATMTSLLLMVLGILCDNTQDLVCVANREGKTVECVGAGLHSPQFLGQSSSVIQNLGRVYAIAGRGAALLAVTVQGSYYDPPTKVQDTD